MFVAMLACTGCPDGERCDRATYEAGCEGTAAWTYCADKSHTGMKKLYPTVQRIPCERDSTCMEFGEVATCVAEPAEVCVTVDATRCVNGLRQTCRDVDAISKRSGTQYWYWTGGLGCDGSEGLR
jgi:hypothetical protein